MHFAFCPSCKLSMVLPEGYVSYSPWLAAHQKTCPGEQKPRVLAKVSRRKRKKGEAALPFDVTPTDELNEAFERLTASLLRQAIKKFTGK